MFRFSELKMQLNATIVVVCVSVIKGQIPYTVVRIFSHSNEMYFLQTKTNVVFDKWTKKPKHIVSVNLILK